MRGGEAYETYLAVLSQDFLFLVKKIGCSFKYKRTTEIEINFRED